MTDWTSLVRPSLHGLEPYDPGPSVEELRSAYGVDEIVRLNRNEDLFEPLPAWREAVAAELDNIWMYPEESYSELREALAAWIGTTPERIVPAHGTQALIGTVATLFVDPGDVVVVPQPTYGLYAQASSSRGAIVRRVPLRDLRLDLEALAAAARETAARLVWVCDPNNPTGSLTEPDEWRAFLAALPPRCVAVADEAYADYVDPALRLGRERDVEAGRPLVVLRTLSKLFGLAGLRLGYAVADPELAHFLDVVHEPFNVNRAALAAGRASLARPELIEERRQAVAAARDLLCLRLVEAGVEPMPSQANFVLVRVGGDDRELARALAEEDGLLVRTGSEYGLDGYVRITVGPPELMERVAAAIARVRTRAQDPRVARQP
ncbi:MAG TPA: aminotransferase class I/II-fold pyridoxal phosphate-dependent enzyme [Gaiellaceae bacterium]|nr:aminotransferase class I/II-fold pyridoxal phosphate-dependent enzyme [Gaiellaceae bacterium]